MENSPRKLTVCKDFQSHGKPPLPSVLVKGVWFKNYGFYPGDQVIITNPKPHTLIMTVHKTAAEMDKERKKKDQQVNAFIKSLK